MRALHDSEVDLTPYTEYRDYPVHLARLNWLWQTIQANRPAGRPVRVLDVGCGTGNITIPLGHLPDSEVLGIDLDEPNVAVTRQRNDRPNVRIELAYLQDVDVRGFDFIVFTEVLEHIPNYREVLTDLVRRMDATAQILITIPNGWGPFEISQWPMYGLRKIGLNGFIRKVKDLVGKKEPYATNQEETPHVNFFTQGQLAADCARLGLRVAQFEKAFVLSPVFETYLPFVSLQRLAPLDNRLAQHLPRALASGWYLRLVKG